MDATIRAASPNDAAAIAGVHVTSLRASATDLLPAHLTPIVLPPADAAPRARAWKRWIERKRTSTFVSLAGATVTGFCTLHPATDDARASTGAGGAENSGQEAAGASAGAACAEIASFYVLPSEWRRGTGRSLGSRALAEARARGFAEVMLWVLETNARARRFYESLGFQPDGASKVFLERPYASWRELRYRRAV
ncbi:MAG: GNAT family N-acetyltransferase [Acidobacteria bacterium]|nr:GNAT family N-acetyltransferase [Acidobacteriota bacterium]